MMKRTVLTFVFILLWLAFPCRGDEVKIIIKVVSEQANIRLEPDIGSIIILQAPQGTLLDSIGKEGEWYKIRMKKEGEEPLDGYVHESLVVKVESIPPETTDVNRDKTVSKPRAPLIRRYYPESEESPLLHLDVSLFGAGLYASVSELNEGAVGLSNLLEELQGVHREGKVSPVRFGLAYGGEITLPMTSVLFIGVGVSYYWGEKESTVEYPQEPGAYSYKTRPRFQALPVQISLTYYLAPNFYLKGGFEYIFAECSYRYRIESQDVWYEWQGEARSQKVGLIGGVGYSTEIVPRIHFFIEMLGRSARISGFKGTDIYTESTGNTWTENGILYFYHGQISGQASYPLLFIRGQKPTEAGVFNPVEATIDLSGVQVSAGIRFRF